MSMSLFGRVCVKMIMDESCQWKIFASHGQMNSAFSLLYTIGTSILLIFVD